jgi:hypothetical protein
MRFQGGMIGTRVVFGWVLGFEVRDGEAGRGSCFVLCVVRERTKRWVDGRPHVYWHEQRQVLADDGKRSKCKVERCNIWNKNIRGGSEVWKQGVYKWVSSKSGGGGGLQKVMALMGEGEGGSWEWDAWSRA